ncbi:Hypothetical protein PHPALM_8586 [Phytophthora palmivora]|uniref:Uncharacterized protein n=1 Tax=Phytophthora palmivora TaxID=4796 RepID=A0A2P4Y9G5_9STRA|nr:Hypothetical protein PHPALM_8586 [Phytophthora palmivora]
MTGAMLGLDEEFERYKGKMYYAMVDFMKCFLGPLYPRGPYAVLHFQSKVEIVLSNLVSSCVIVWIDDRFDTKPAIAADQQQFLCASNWKRGGLVDYARVAFPDPAKAVYLLPDALDAARKLNYGNRIYPYMNRRANYCYIHRGRIRCEYKKMTVFSEAVYDD